MQARHIDEGAAGRGAVAWGDGGLHVDGMGLVCPWDAFAPRGRHNRENALAAAALAAHAGLSATAIASGIASFVGGPHRLEVVAEIDGVRYINDSKATNPEAAMAALNAEPTGVHLIIGGQAKGTPFAPLAAVASGPVVRAYVIGEASVDIAEAFATAGIAIERSGRLSVAVRAAAARARPGEVVLLAPACASFDQFTGYEDRGDQFRALVATLPSGR